MKHILLCTFLVMMLSLHLAVAQEKGVIVYEAWLVHMESAGGWVAKDKNYYGKVRVDEIQGGPDISPIQKVIASAREGTIAFGIDYPENLIGAREKDGFDLVAVSVDFQNTAMRIISWKPIRSAKDIRGDFGIWTGYETKPKCAAGKGWEKQLTIQNQGVDIMPWLTGKWEMASAMTYNELILAQREVKKRGKTFYTVDYKDLGIDWLDNVLFTTEEITRRHPDVVQALIAGRYRGFKWALENPKEALEILKKVNEDLDFVHEMDAVSPIKALMITPDTKRYGLGYISPKKWEKVARGMFRAGLLERMPDARGAYTEKFPSGITPR